MAVVFGTLHYFEDPVADDDTEFQQFAQAVEYAHGYTLLPDAEMLYVLEEDLLAELALALQTEVYGLLVHSASATYGFSWFDSSASRQFLVQDGEVVLDVGAPLPLENGVKLDATATAATIEAIAANAGIPFASN